MVLFTGVFSVCKQVSGQILRKAGKYTREFLFVYTDQVTECRDFRTVFEYNPLRINGENGHSASPLDTSNYSTQRPLDRTIRHELSPGEETRGVMANQMVAG